MADHGLMRSAGVPLPVCATCDLYEPDPIKLLITRVAAAIAAAERGESSLSPECLALRGMSSPKVRHLLSALRATHYIEVGAWAGSTLVSATHGQGNRATAIEDFSQFNDGAVPAELRRNIESLIGSERVKLVEQPILTAPSMLLPHAECDVCFYDGDHTLEGTRRAIERLVPCLAEHAVVLIDDTNMVGVADAAREGLRAAGVTIHRKSTFGDCRYLLARRPAFGWAAQPSRLP